MLIALFCKFCHMQLHLDTFYLPPLRSVNVKRNVKMEVFAQNFSKIGANVPLDTVVATAKNVSKIFFKEFTLNIKVMCQIFWVSPKNKYIKQISCL